MISAARRQRTSGRYPPTVVNCYALFDKVFPELGLLDYTEGMYHGDPSTPYEVAQQNQINYVLDEVECSAGTRILDIGCGNGTLLDEVRRRGAVGVGITISPEQLTLCRKRGLDVRLLNYRDLDEGWSGQFDAVVANGPVEHFVQPREALAGLADEIYRQFYGTCHRMIDPASRVRKAINTTIYFVRPPDPADLLRSPWRQRRGSDGFHYAMLARSFGGWYPVEGQLQRAAAGCFELTHEVDGTYDYHLTSEEWLRRVLSEIRRPQRVPRLASRSLSFLLQHPLQFVTMWSCMTVSQSWNWQFRGPNPPTRLLRQTWRYCDRG